MSFFAAADETTILHLPVVLVTAVVAAVVGGLSSFLGQRYLLTKKADVDYASTARLRLYEAVGPLRLQLIMAALDVVRRINGHAHSPWVMSPAEHFGRSFIYRLLRPLAVAQLIERQMTIADFTIDAGALELLRFGFTADRMLSGSDIVLDHPAVDWSTESAHLYRESLRVAAGALIHDPEGGPPLVIDYAQFSARYPDPAGEPSLAALARIFARCRENLAENPVFWLRLVGYGYTCNRLVKEQGRTLGFTGRPFDPAALLGTTDDEHIRSHLAAYVEAIERADREGF